MSDTQELIERHQFIRDEQNCCYCEIDISNHGSYVLYDDHLMFIEALQAEIKRLHIQNQRVDNKSHNSAIELAIGVVGWGLNDSVDLIKKLEKLKE